MSEIQTTKTLNIDYSLKLDCEGNRVEPEMWKLKTEKIINGRERGEWN